MSNEAAEKLRASIKNFVQKVAIPRHRLCTVSAIHETEDKITVDCKAVDNPEVEFPDVRLQAVSTGDKAGMYAVPEIGSHVILAWTDHDINSGYVAMVEKVKEARMWHSDERHVEVTEEGVVMNGGENGGMVIVERLAENLEKEKARLDKVIDILTNWQYSPQDGGKALQLAVQAAATALSDKGDFTDLENEDVKH